MSTPAVFLDRDGVIDSYVYNSEFGTVDSPSNPDEFELLPGAYDAIQALHAMGLLVVVVSNQPGIAKGKFSPHLLDATTAKMMHECRGKIDAVYYCLHHPHALNPEYKRECECRKPKPGLLLQAAREWQIDLPHSVMIGDGLTDVLAGQRAGARTILISARKCYVCDAMDTHRVKPDYVSSTLLDAVRIVKRIYSTVTIELKGAWA